MTKTLLMYDAVPSGVAHIPNDAQAVLGYVDGDYRSFPLLVQRFGGRAHCVSMGVYLGNLAEGTDVEPGNPVNTPDLVRADFLHKRAHGIWRPLYYADRTRMASTVRPGLRDFAREEYRLMLADPEGPMELEGDYEAVQRRFDGPYDITVVDIARFFPAPPPHKVPIIHKPIKKPAPIHPKVTAAGIGGGLTTGLIAFLQSHGVHAIHLQPWEAATITGAAAALFGYLKKSGTIS